MKKSEALREAKKHLDHYMFICLALRFGVDTEAAEEVIPVVAGRVASGEDATRLPCAERWLESQGFDLTPAEMRQWRLMWLDKLIAEFEAKGE